MKNELTVSIIVPVYNAEKYLRQCLNSLLDQGIPKEDYEIICVNDGSGDASLPILKEYADQHENIIIIDKENEGVSAARNAGLDTARGKYVWFIDADDWVATGFLKKEEILKNLNENKIPLILTNCIDVHEDEIRKHSNSRISAKGIHFKEVQPFMTTARAHLFDRELLNRNHIRFDTNLAYGEDLMFMREFLDVIRFENEGGNDFRILQCQGDGIYFYRIHNGSAMGQLHRHIEKMADSILYRARLSLARYRTEDQPAWFRANYQEYVNLFMQEYMLYYFPALNKSMWAHLRELKKEGLYPSPPPKLGWKKPKSISQQIRQFVFKHSAVYPLYYMIMRSRFKKAGSV